MTRLVLARSLFACLLLIALAGITPTEIAHAQTESSLSVPGCQLGNTAPCQQALYFGAFVLNEYALIVDPATDCSVCPLGVSVDSITVSLVDFGSIVGCDITLQPFIAELATGDELCPQYPGADLCTGPLVTVTLPYQEETRITMALDPDCPCLTGPFVIGVRTVDTTCFSLLTVCATNGGTTCGSFWRGDPSLPWQGISDFTLSLSADLTCWEEPVSVEPTTWGRIKALYMN